MRPKSWKCFWSIWHHYTLFSYIFSGSRCTLSMKVATKVSIKVKKQLSKFRFLGCFSKSKTEECNLKVGNVFDQFGIPIRCSATYFLEVGARPSLKVARKGSIRDKKTLKNWIFSLFFYSKNRRVRPESWNYSWSIWNHYTWFSYLFCRGRCTRFIESSQQRVY